MKERFWLFVINVFAAAEHMAHSCWLWAIVKATDAAYEGYELPPDDGRDAPF